METPRKEQKNGESMKSNREYWNKLAERARRAQESQRRAKAEDGAEPERSVGNMSVRATARV